MLIESVRVKNFLTHGAHNEVVDFTSSPLWLVEGENGAGKTALFEAIELALYGRSRLGKQQYPSLVKHGEERAEIEVVFAHRGQRYRVTRQLHSRRGNEGGTLFREEQGQWVTLPEDPWKYVDAHIVSYDNFCRGIYLHQDEFDRFLKDSDGRGAAMLMDLSEFDQLASLAKDKAVSEKQAAATNQETFRSLGDVRPETIEAAEADVHEAEAGLSRAQGAAAQAATAESDALQWNEAQEQLERCQHGLQGHAALIADAEAIRAAASAVQAWDVVAPQLRRFWECQGGVAEAQRKAGEAAAAARQAEEELTELTAVCAGLETHWQAQRDTTLPRLREEQRSAQTAQSALKLEAAIAHGIARVAQADEALSQLQGAPDRLAKVQAQLRALPALEALVEARKEHASAQSRLTKTQDKLARAKQDQEEALVVAAAAQSALTEAEAASRTAESAVTKLNDDIDKIELEIKRHRQLGRGVQKCPICDRTMDAGARQHVRALIEQKQRDLKALKQTQPRVRRDAQQAKGRLKKATATAQAAQGDGRKLEGRAQKLEATVEAEDENVRRTEKRIASALAVARREAKGLEVDLEGVMARQAAALRRTLTDELESAQTDVIAHTDAMRRRQEAHSAVQALCGQRTDASMVLGDTGDVAAVEAALVQAETILGAATRAVNTAERTEIELGEQLRAKRAEQATQAERAQAQAHLSAQYTAEAEALIAERDGLVIPDAWQACTQDEGCYQQASDEAEAQRPRAQQEAALDVSEAETNRLTALAEQQRQRQQAIPEAHRVARETAHAWRLEAESALGAARLRLDGAARRAHELHVKRGLADQLESAVGRALHDSDLYSDLARLLGTDGLVQNRVIESVQEEICARANEILERAGDSLEVHLGKPLRKGSAEKDFIFSDRQEPMGGERAYKLLSAGQQTRVAMAIAAVVHQRISGNEVGTLIIDEAFCRMDEAHCLEYAEEIGDAANGWLQQGVVAQIIVTTHIGAVHRFFPARYRIARVDGSARVTRVSD